MALVVKYHAVNAHNVMCPHSHHHVTEAIDCIKGFEVPCGRVVDSATYTVAIVTDRETWVSASGACDRLCIVRDEDCPKCGFPETFAEGPETTGPDVLGCRKCGWRSPIERAQ